ncbi:MAG: SIMPL domain-containing protein [Bacteroidetes bacterium]|nr:SIMPL domain-containing protein [Bacteroidota bacterium]
MLRPIYAVQSAVRRCVISATRRTGSSRLVMAMAFLVVLGLALPVAAQNASITVSAQGVITTEPDMATVRFSVVTTGDSPTQAQDDNAEASASAMNAIRSLGIEESDLEMANLQLVPRREYDPERRIYLEKGFEATRRVEVQVRDLDQLPELMSQLVDSGANRIDGVQYGLDDRDDVELEALALAVRRAREKATVMAGALDERLGAVWQIAEQGISVPQPMLRMDAMEMASMSKDANPDAFAAGEIEVSASVTVVFLLAQ